MEEILALRALSSAKYQQHCKSWKFFRDPLGVGEMSITSSTEEAPHHPMYQ